MTTAKILKIINLEEMASQLDHSPIIINDQPLETEKDRKRLEEMAVTTYNTTDVLVAIPSCECRKTTEGKNLGTICKYCGTKVEMPMTRSIQSDLWIRAPEEVGKLVTPLTWILISDLAMAGRTFNTLAWFCDPLMSDPEPNNIKGTRLVDKLKATGLQRGFRSFIQNFDTVVDVFLRGETRVDVREDYYAFFAHHRKDIFTKMIPLPSKIAIVVEKTAVGSYYDDTVNNCVEAIFTAANLSSERDQRRLESRITSVMVLLCKYYSAVIGDTLSSKPGWLRRVVYGSRMNFTFRSIITSYHEPHDYSTILVPYKEMLSMLLPMVMNKLIWKRGWKYRDAIEYIESHASDCDPLLWEILEELIDETPVPERPNPAIAGLPSTLRTRERKGVGIACTFTRYPSLARTSTQYLHIVGLTKSEIRLSVLVLKGPNADFDKMIVCRSKTY